MRCEKKTLDGRVNESDGAVDCWRGNRKVFVVYVALRLCYSRDDCFLHTMRAIRIAYASSMTKEIWASISI
jgi:hypothetical protein